MRMLAKRDITWASINFARRRGWDVRRFDPSAALPDYLRHVLFPHFGVNCVLDVGAHHGGFALSLREVGYSGTIASFEPVAATYEVLRERAAGDARWHTFECALGSIDGTTRIIHCDTINKYSYIIALAAAKKERGLRSRGP